MKITVRTTKDGPSPEMEKLLRSFSVALFTATTTTKWMRWLISPNKEQKNG